MGDAYLQTAADQLGSAKTKRPESELYSTHARVTPQRATICSYTRKSGIVHPITTELQEGESPRCAFLLFPATSARYCGPKVMHMAAQSLNCALGE